MTAPIRIDLCVGAAQAGKRLDQALAELAPAYSRARLQAWIKAGYIRVDGRPARTRDRVLGGERVEGEAPHEVATAVQAQALDLDIRYQDAELIVINKSAGMVVHPAVGNPDGTLVNALLHYAPELEALPRAGLVHRLDKDTTGLLVVARSLRAHASLVAQLQARTVAREYDAIVCGVLTAGGTVNAPLGRHPLDRKRMAVVATGRAAVTHYRVVDRFRAHTQLRIRLETGRTHQIRVHMAHLRQPLLGDAVYGARLRIPPVASPALAECLRGFRRQALHAARLALTHPLSGEPLEWQAEPPADMRQLLALLRQDKEPRDERSGD